MNGRFMYVNGSCWQEPLYRHLVCYLQNLEQKQTTSRVFVDLFCSTLFSKGALRLSVPPLCPQTPCLCGRCARAHRHWYTAPLQVSEFCCPVLGVSPAPLCRHRLCSDHVLLKFSGYAGLLLSPGSEKVVLKPPPVTIDVTPVLSPY